MSLIRFPTFRVPGLPFAALLPSHLYHPACKTLVRLLPRKIIEAAIIGQQIGRLIERSAELLGHFLHGPETVGDEDRVGPNAFEQRRPISACRVRRVRGAISPWPRRASQDRGLPASPEVSSDAVFGRRSDALKNPNHNRRRSRHCMCLVVARATQREYPPCAAPFYVVASFR